MRDKNALGFFSKRKHQLKTRCRSRVFQHFAAMRRLAGEYIPTQLLVRAAQAKEATRQHGVARDVRRARPAYAAGIDTGVPHQRPTADGLRERVAPVPT